MKWTTVVKIAFCVLLCAVLACAGFGVRFGSNRLHAQTSRVRNADFFNVLCADFEHNTDLIRGFAMTSEEFEAKFLSDFSEYYGMRLQITAQNRTNRDVTVLGIEVNERDEQAHVLYLSRTPETTVTIPAGTTEPKNIWFDLVVESLGNEDVLSVLRKDFNMKLLYVDASSGVTSLADADKSQLHAEWIRAPRG